MADSKISALANEAPVLADYVPFIKSADTTNKRATFTQIKAALTSPDNIRWWVLDYNDLATQSTPISIPWTWTYTNLTNDQAWPNTNKTYAPSWITDVWSSANNRFEWTQLKLWDIVNIRLDVSVIVATTNTEIAGDLFIADGTWSEYQIPFIPVTNFKNTWTYRLVDSNFIYMGNTVTLNNYARFKIKSDKACTVKVNGWACDVSIRG